MDLLALLADGLRPLLAVALTPDPEACAHALSAWHDGLGPEGLAASPDEAGLLLPLIAERVLASAPASGAADVLAPALRARLVGIRRQVGVRRLQVDAALEPLLARLHAAGLDPRRVGPHGPGSPPEGPSSRVDLAVPTDHFALATTILEAYGWRPHTPVAATLVRHAGPFLNTFDLDHLDGVLTVSRVPLTLHHAPTAEPAGLIALARQTLTALARGAPRPRLDPALFLTLARLGTDPNFDVHRNIDAARRARVTLTVRLLIDALLTLQPEAASPALVALRAALAHASQTPHDGLERATLTRLLDPHTTRPIAAWTTFRHAHAAFTTPRAALAFAPVALSRVAFRILR